MNDAQHAPGWKHPSTWVARLPRARPIAAAIGGLGLALLIVGGLVSPAASPSDPNITLAVASAPLHSTTLSSTATNSTATHPTVEHPAAIAHSKAAKKFTLRNYHGRSGIKVKATLRKHGLKVTVRAAGGGSLPKSLAGWVVVSEKPAAGTAVRKGTRVILTLRLKQAPSPTPTPTVAPSSPAAVPVAPAPAPAPPAPAPRAPAPRAPAPAPAPPAPAPPAPAPAPATGTVNPGGFCSPSDVGHAGVASNGHTYVCGAKGADASGHYHWNS